MCFCIRKHAISQGRDQVCICRGRVRRHVRRWLCPVWPLVDRAARYGEEEPEFALFLTFAVMALVLLLRPSGLFGRKLA